MALLLATAAVSAVATAAPVGSAAKPKAPGPDPDLVEIGRRLFFDPVASRSGMRACADCHDPAHGYSDPKAKSLDDRGRTGGHSQTLVDVADSTTFHWRGDVKSITEIVSARVKPTEIPPAYYGPPVIDPNDPTTVVEVSAKAAPYVPGVPSPAPDDGFVAKNVNLARLPTCWDTLSVWGRYREAILTEFSDGDVTLERVTKAIEAYVRSLRSGESPYDRFVAGDKQAMSPAAQRGHDLFRGAAGCTACHSMSGPRAAFSDYTLHEVPADDARPTSVELGVAGRCALNVGEAIAQAAPVASASPEPGAVASSIAVIPFPSITSFPLLATGLRVRKTPVTPPDPVIAANAKANGRVQMLKTPTLRDVAARSAWTHGGRFSSLEAAIRRFLPPEPFTIASADLGPAPTSWTEDSVADLAAFLRALSSDRRPGLAPTLWTRRATKTRLRVVDADGNPLARFPMTLVPAGDTLVADCVRVPKVCVTNSYGELEYAPPPFTHMRIALEGGLAPLGGALVPDTCQSTKISLPIRGRTRVVVTLHETRSETGATVPPTLVAEHTNAQFFPDRRVPATLLHVESSASLGDGRAIAVYSAPMRTDFSTVVRLMVPTTDGVVPKFVNLSREVPVAVDLAH